MRTADSVPPPNHPDHDPMFQWVELPYAAEIRCLGTTVAVSSNEPDVPRWLARRLEPWPPANPDDRQPVDRQPDDRQPVEVGSPDSQVRFQLRCVVEPGGAIESPPAASSHAPGSPAPNTPAPRSPAASSHATRTTAPVFREHGRLYQVVTPAGSTAAYLDPSHPTGLANLRRWPLDAPSLDALLVSPVLRHATHRGLVPVHAAGIVTPNGPVVVRGRAGAGKSTLAAWAVIAGWTILADEVVWVDLAPQPNARLRGIPWQIQLDPGATDVLPAGALPAAVSASRPARSHQVRGYSESAEQPRQQHTVQEEPPSQRGQQRFGQTDTSDQQRQQGVGQTDAADEQRERGIVGCTEDTQGSWLLELGPASGTVEAPLGPIVFLEPAAPEHATRGGSAKWRQIEPADALRRFEADTISGERSVPPRRRAEAARRLVAAGAFQLDRGLPADCLEALTAIARAASAMS